MTVSEKRPVRVAMPPSEYINKLAECPFQSKNSAKLFDKWFIMWYTSIVI